MTRETLESYVRAFEYQSEGLTALSHYEAHKATFASHCDDLARGIAAGNVLASHIVIGTIRQFA